MTIIDHPSPNHSERKTGVCVDTVLIHHTGTDGHGNWGDLSALWTLCSPKAGVSAHYLVKQSGDVLRLVPEHLKAWHAGKGCLPWETCEPYDVNHRSIGIEVVNPGDGQTPFTEAQYAALEWLVSDVVRRLGWDVVHMRAEGREWMLRQGAAFLASADPSKEITYGYVLGHRDVAPGRKTDPADNFDWGRIRKALAGGVA